MVYTPPVYYVYFAQSLLTPDAIKIGITEDHQKRMKTLHAKLLLLLRFEDHAPALKMEKDLHKRLSHARIVGEWFRRKEVEPLYNHFNSLKHPDVWVDDDLCGDSVDGMEFDDDAHDFYSDEWFEARYA